MLDKWWDAPNPWETGMEHTAWLFGVIVALYTLWKGFSVWRQKRLDRQIQRSKNADRLEAIYTELHPNGGSSIADKINRIESSVSDNKAKIDKAAAENVAEHSELHRRIDGIFTLLVGNDAAEPRRIAGKHHNRSRDSSDDETENTDD